MEGIFATPWRFLPEMFWAGWIISDIIFATARHGDCFPYKTAMWRPLSRSAFCYFVWWAGGFFSYWGWPQWIMLSVTLWRWHIMSRYDGKTIMVKRDVWMALMLIFLHTILLHMGGFW